MEFIPENVSLWIVNFKRHNELRQTIRQWMNSFDFEEINIIANHSSTTIDIIDDEFKDKTKIWNNIFREDWETGSIAWCWNQAMKFTFENKDWCVMSQDDVYVSPGWPDIIQNTDYWTYIAPVGDVIQVQSIEGFKQVGWFDERFRAIGGPEADYQLRIIKQYKDKASVWDDHVWHQRLNTVGLENHFMQSPRAGEVLEQRNQFNVPFAQEECFNRWIEKWRMGVDELFLSESYHLNPVWPEIDWYPATTKRWRELGRI